MRVKCVLKFCDPRPLSLNDTHLRWAPVRKQWENQIWMSVDLFSIENYAYVSHSKGPSLDGTLPWQENPWNPKSFYHLSWFSDRGIYWDIDLSGTKGVLMETPETPLNPPLSLYTSAPPKCIFWYSITDNTLFIRNQTSMTWYYMHIMYLRSAPVALFTTVWEYYRLVKFR